MEFSKKVKARRIELGLSQEELAKRMGYSSRTSINKIENGRPVSQKIISRLADALDVTVAYLMGWEELDKYNNDSTIGALLKSLRTNNNISLVEVAEEMHISVDDVKQYENGTKNVPLPILMAFAKYYNISFTDITGVHIGDDERSHTTITQNERLVRLKLKWEEEIGYNTLSDDEIDKVIEYAKFLVSQRKEKE